MSKLSRQLAIKDIIAARDISNQDDLRRELKRKGFTVTQATLSRDLHELGVIRTSTKDGAKYVLHTAEPRSDIRILSGREIISIDSNETLIVIVTLPGCANAVAQYIDAQQYDGILGTVAGDDTILVIPKKVKEISLILKYLRNLLLE
jgi:transcriptional regulator of arginine metabolism